MEKFIKWNVLRFPIIKKRKEGVRVKEWIRFGKKPALVLYNELRGKRKIDHPTDEIADLLEKLACEIGKLLGVKCPNILLGTAKGKNCCISIDFLEKGQIMYNGDAILPKYEKMVDIHMNSYEECEFLFSQVFGTFKKLDKLNSDSMKNDFFKMVLIDYLLGNGDRSNKNWCVIGNKKIGRYWMGPAFDNADLFCESHEMKNYCDYSISDFNVLIKYVIENFIEIDDFIQQLEQNITKEKLEEIFYKLDDGRDLKKDKKIVFILSRKKVILEKHRMLGEDYEKILDTSFENSDEDYKKYGTCSSNSFSIDF